MSEQPLILEEAGFQLVPKGIYLDNYALPVIPPDYSRAQKNKLLSDTYQFVLKPMRPWEKSVFKNRPPQYQLLYLWTPDCASCASGAQLLSSMEINRQIPANLRVMLIAYDTDEISLLNEMERLSLKIPIYMDKDGNLAHRLGITAAPASYLIDSRGEMIARQNGIVNFDSQGFEILLAKLALKNKDSIPSNASLPLREFLTKEVMTSSQSPSVKILEIPLFGWFSLGFLAIVCYSAWRSIMTHRRHLKRLHDEKRAGLNKS